MCLLGSEKIRWIFLVGFSPTDLSSRIFSDGSSLVDLLRWIFSGRSSSTDLISRIFSDGSSQSDLLRRNFSVGSSLTDLFSRIFSGGSSQLGLLRRIFSIIPSPSDLFRRPFSSLATPNLIILTPSRNTLDVVLPSASDRIKYIFITCLVYMTQMLQFEGEC